MTQGMFLAKALFDNVAETPDELAFRRGDVLTVVEQNTKDLDGWWLCSLRGKQGIAPGNRLKILSGMGESAGGTLKGEALNKNMMDLYNPNARDTHDYDVPPSNRDFIDVRSLSRRPSYDALRNSAGSRKASLLGDLYDTPPSSKRGSAENDNGIYDTPPSSKRASSERTPPHSNRSSASRDSGSNLLSTNSPNQLSINLQQNGNAIVLPAVVRHRNQSNSSDNCYETPPGSNRSSLERILSEEGPPIYESISPALSKEHLDTDDPVYDTPPTRSYIQTRTIHVSQSGLYPAVSSESLMSSTSGVSISQTASLPDSARSSMDLPSDIYDVLPSSQQGEKSRKQLSMDSGLGFYDSPLKSRPSSSASNTDGMRTSQSSVDCKPSPSAKDIKRCKSLENTVDDLYDTPKNNTPKVSIATEARRTNSLFNTSTEPSNVYDIPPQVTRDSVISMTSNSSDENKRLSSSSLDSEQQLADVLLWDELLLDLNSAQELLIKKHQDVSKATSRLCSFVNNTWRSRSSLEKTLYDIKVSCTLVRNTLRDFVDFSRGVIANAVRLPDYYLANMLLKYVSPLQNTLELVNKSFLKLEEMKWQVSLLAEPLDKSKSDDLGQIALVAKDLMSDVKKIATFIQSNGHLLFKKAFVGESKKVSTSSKPPVGPKVADSTGGKGTSIGSGQVKTMQHRPLPAVPLDEKNLPSTGTPSVLDTSKLSMYDIKAVLHQDDYAECDELSSKTDREQADKAVMEQCIQEYDYVRLDQRGTGTKSQSKHIQESGKILSQNEKDKIFKNNEIKLSEPEGKGLQMKNSETSVADIDIIPVKENASYGSSEITKSKDQRKFSVTNLGESTAPSYDDMSLLEQDLKTPVNINTSSDGSKFILPSPTSGNLQSKPEVLDPNDRQVLVYYTEQMNSHSTLLANAVDAFIGVVGNKEPPNVFISHSKFVIVSAHKLVHIGDSIHRNLISNSVSMRIMQCANNLCDSLKASVTATKSAALQYPSATAVQEMVDRVIAVSHAAHELKLAITQAAK